MAKTPKRVNDLYDENYTALLQQLKRTQNLNDVLCSWLGRLNIVTIPIQLKRVCRFSATPMKCSMSFLQR